VNPTIDLLLSIVIPSYNRRASLERLLLALERQTVPPEQFEVLVVDDGSTDGTFDRIRQLRTAYTLRVLQQPNAGPAGARNRGVREARADLVLFLDDDVVPVDDLIAQHLGRQQGEADAVVIGPMVPPPGWQRPAWIRWEEDMLEGVYRALRAGEYPCTPRQFYTANASLRRSRFLAAGGFDPAYRRAEDVELAYRLRNAGAVFVFLPQAAVHHYASRTFGAWSRTPYQYGRYDVLMHAQGHEALSCAVVEFHTRHVLTRVVARACVGHRRTVRAAVALLRVAAAVADRAGADRIARLGLGAIFNLLYWQGVCDELGDRRRVWRAVNARAVVA
jgi:GT2 family glycosyltransferase